ncbi:GntR family transcriptional regulator [Kitasatospora sp. NPDC096147]|uniref:GntR family transcriptional regulator n=1 Tax=Kitasatospora sp. NPDC096147 TaxID=3364093 RepID=UPI0037F9DF81
MSDEPSPYLHVAERIRDRIGAGEFEEGDRLPSLTQLVADYGYSISVGQKAYGLLEQEGLVVARHGRGYFVSSQEPPTLLTRRPGGSGPAEDGVKLTWRSESATARATETAAARLEIEPGGPVMHTKYVYSVDGVPSHLVESWEPMAVTGGTLIVLPEAGPYGGIGVVERMAVIGIEVGDPVERVTARTLTRAEALLLGVAPGAPVSAVERTHYDQATGRPVETADLVLPGDRWATEYGRRPARRG